MSRAADLAAQVNQALGFEAIKMGNDPAWQIEMLPTGVLPIDVLLDGGFARGRITELYGNASTLKSYLALCCIAQTQKAGGTCALIDTEHAYDPAWAEKLGVNRFTLLVQHPETGEQAVDTTEVLVRGGIDLVVWDSVAATLPKTEHGKSAQDTVQPARLAELMSRSLRKINAANSKTAIVYVNQTRTNVGVTFGSTEALPGGKALGFYASMRVSLRRTGKEYRDVGGAREVVGHKIVANIEKSRLNKPHRDVHLYYNLSSGTVDEAAWIVSWGVEHGTVTGKGSGTWEWRGATTLRARGRVNLTELVRANLDTIRPEVESVCLGDSPRRRSSGASEKPKSSSKKAAGSTRKAGQGRSSTTAVRKPRSSK